MIRAARQMLDAQQAFAFLISQLTYIEPQIYRTRYQDIQYPELIPIDTSAPEWIKTVTLFSIDQVGQAKWIHARGQDIPFADINRNKGEETIHMAGIGYEYNLEELSQAAYLGIPLTPEKASAARRAYQEFMEVVAFQGSTEVNYSGLINNANVTASNAPNGAGGSPTWALKTGPEIVADVNAILTNIWTPTLGIEMADTLLIPLSMFPVLTSRVLQEGSDTTVWSFIQQNNLYTARTGRALTIRAINGLETAGSGSTRRIVAYRRSPEVLKMHVPMPHRFLPPQGPIGLNYEVPGIFRTGSVDIRLPKAVRYLDGV